MTVLDATSTSTHHKPWCDLARCSDDYYMGTTADTGTLADTYHWSTEATWNIDEGHANFSTFWFEPRDRVEPDRGVKGVLNVHVDTEVTTDEIENLIAWLTAARAQLLVAER